jgi:hypothetical protein
MTSTSDLRRSPIVDGAPPRISGDAEAIAVA